MEERGIVAIKPQPSRSFYGYGVCTIDGWIG